MEWYEDGYVQLTSETPLALTTLFGPTVDLEDEDEINNLHDDLMNKFQDNSIF